MTSSTFLRQLPYLIIVFGVIVCAALVWDLLRSMRAKRRNNADHLPSRHPNQWDVVQRELEQLRTTLTDHRYPDCPISVSSLSCIGSPRDLVAALDRDGLTAAEISRKIGFAAADVRFVLKIQQLAFVNRLVRDSEMS
jgi:hypothetical protein